MPVSVAPPTAADWSAWGFSGPPEGPIAGLDPRLDWDDFTGDDPVELSLEDNLGEPSASVVRVLTPQTSPGVGRKPFPRFGINAAKLYFKESGRSSKYGALAVILDDIEELGASFLRQTGFCDLVWPDGVEVPLAADMDGVAAALSPPLEALFNELQNRSLQVVFTLFQIARFGYRDPAGGTAAQPPDPLGEIGPSASPLLFPPSIHSDSSAVFVDPSGVSWTILDVEDRTGARRTLDASVSTSETYQWAYGIFDPRSPYKRNLLRAFAASVARLLDQLDTANPTWRVYETILAIELGNEVDRKNIADFTGVASTRGPELWAGLVAEMVGGLEDGWGAGKLPVSLWYPSIASWGGGISFFPNPSSSDLSVRRFQTTMLAAIRARLSGTQLGFFTNQDYHFYHTVSDGLHYGVPPEELARMAISLPSLPTVGTQPTLSICETGTSVGYVDNADSGGVQGEPKEVSQDYQYASDAAGRPDRAVLDAFQAREVWRRLAMGAASGAAFLAWTTHISSANAENEFAHFGLRDDDERDSGTQPEVAQPRLAWSAFQRLTTLLDWGTGSARVARASVVRSAAITPDSKTGGWNTPSSDVVADYLVILRFRGLSRGRYAYLLFIDPTCPEPTKTVAVEALSGSKDDLATLVATVPTPGTPATAASTDEFPAATHSFAADVRVSINGYVFDLGVDSDPVLIFADRVLEFRV